MRSFRLQNKAPLMGDYPFKPTMISSIPTIDKAACMSVCMSVASRGKYAKLKPHPTATRVMK